MNSMHSMARQAGQTPEEEHRRYAQLKKVEDHARHRRGEED